MNAALAEKERAMISACTKAAPAGKVGKGLLGNRTNLAEASAKGIAIQRADSDAFTANVLPVIESSLAAGTASLRGIAAQMNARKVATARGGAPTAAQVQRVLRRLSAGP